MKILFNESIVHTLSYNFHMLLCRKFFKMSAKFSSKVEKWLKYDNFKFFFGHFEKIKKLRIKFSKCRYWCSVGWYVCWVLCCYLYISLRNRHFNFEKSPKLAFKTGNDDFFQECDRKLLFLIIQNKEVIEHYKYAKFWVSICHNLKETADLISRNSKKWRPFWILP